MDRLSAAAPYQPSDSLSEYEDVTCHLTIDYLLKKFGNKSNSQILKQPGVKFFGNAEGVVGYSSVLFWLGRRYIVFANPLCCESSYAKLLSAFLATRPHTVFVSVDNSVSETLKYLGYKTNHFGWENTLDIQGFNTVGSKKKQLRKARNNWSDKGAVVVEQPWSEVDQQSVLNLSDQWRQNKQISGRELTLFTRPPEFKDEPGVRKFYCYLNNQLIGYVFFLPIYKNHNIIGYGSNITRSLPGAEHSGVIDYILLKAIEQFKAEGLSVLSLGISPLYALQANDNERPFLRRIMELSFKYLNGLYAFNGLANHKKKYRSEGEQWFICTRENMSVLQLWYCLGVASRVFGFNCQRAEIHA